MVFKIQPLILLCVFIGIFLQMEVVLPQDDTNTDTADTNQQDENTSTEHWKPPKEDDCEDKDDDCLDRILFCENHNGVTPKKMHEKCKKTCGLCVPKDFKCKDNRLTHTCKAWKNNGFCLKHKKRSHRKGARKYGKSHYPKAVMLLVCAKTCGFC